MVGIKRGKEERNSKGSGKIDDDGLVKRVSGEKKDTMEVVAHFIYGHLGRRLLQNKTFSNFFYKDIYNSRYETILRESNLKVLPEEYLVSVMLIIGFLTGITILNSLIFLPYSFLIGSSIFYFGILLIFGVGFFLYNYPLILSKNRKKEIDASIPYLLPYMKILSKELSLTKLINLVDEFLIYKEVKIEFQKIKHYSDFLGYDINSSIREAMASCPSKDLKDMMNDLVSITDTGGDIYIYLDRKLDNLNQEIEAIEKKNIDTLLIYSQIYVIILLIAPLFFAIMASILDIISQASDIAGGSGGMDTVALLVMLFMFLPLLYGGFMMLIYYSRPLYARLKPMSK